MADEEPIGGGLGGSGIKSKLRSTSAKMALDATSVNKVTAAVKSLNSAVSSLKDNLKSVASHWSQVMGATGTGAGKNSYLPASTTTNMVTNAQTGVGGPSGGSGYMAKFANVITTVGGKAQSATNFGLNIAGKAIGVQGLGISNLGSTLATPQMQAGMAMGGAVSQIVNSVSSAISTAMNNRISTGYDYSLAADKMNLMYSQMTGMSRLGVSSAFRQPLMNYRLGGPGAINDLMAMQAATGISALGQASSVEALRTASGFGYSTADIARMTATLGTPQVANRMFMTMGKGLYGIGGKQNTTMDVIQSAVRAAGLTNEALAQSALQQGSMSRKRLEFLGLPEDMQNLVIQYAQENIQFQKKGGKGMYDPSRKADRALMGDVEGAFATQKEETERIKTVREENFYRRQVDNFADLEKMTQRITKAFGALEDTLSGIIGKRIGLGPLGSAAGGAMKGIGSGLMMAGGMMSVASGGPGAVVGVPMMAIGAALNLFGGGLGDPMETTGGGKSGPGSSNMSTKGQTTAQNIDSTVVPTGDGKTTTIGNIKQWGSFKGLHPTMQSRLIRLMVESGGRVGFGGGVRSTAAQRDMFLSRYTPTTEKTEIFWDGKYWKHTSGAPAAPPGRSMHEIGLAADMVGDMGWLVSNSAKYGLKNFNEVNGEPWHLQPSELPNGRSAYEKGGASWGKGPAGSEPYDPTTQFGGSDSDGSPTAGGVGGGGGGGNRLNALSGQSMTSALSVFKQQSMDELLSGGRGSGSTTGAGGLDYAVGAGTTTQHLSGVLSGKEIVNLLKTTGKWSGDELTTAVAVAWEESRWNPNSHAVNSTESSYGLFQINMKEEYAEGRRRVFGLSKNEDLFDPVINVKAARQMYDAAKIQRGDAWYDWGAYKGASAAEASTLAMAAATIRSAESGDPYSPGNAGGGGNITVTNGGTSITIAPIIHMNGQGGNADLQRIAREVGKLLSNEVQAKMMRKR